MMYGFQWIILLFVIPSSLSVLLYVNPSTSKNATDLGTLQYYLCINDATIVTGTVLVLSSHGHHTLLKSDTCVLYGMYNITITSQSSNAHILCEGDSSGTGLAFINMTLLTLKGIIFTNCGGLLSPTVKQYINKSRIYFPSDTRTVLLIINSYSVRIRDVTITGHYCGYGMIISHSYDVLLHTVSLLHGEEQKCNKPYYTKDHTKCTSSGLLFYYYYNNSSNINHYYTDAISNSMLLMYVTIQCHSNTYRRVDMEWFLQGSFKVPVNAISAGGLTLYIRGQQWTNFTFVKVTIKGNLGGGALIVLYTVSRQPILNILQSTLSQNVLKGNGGSLAVYIISQLAQGNNNSQQCAVCITDCSVTESSAIGGYSGGVYIAVGSDDNKWIPPVSLQDMYMIGNSASYGASTIYLHGFTTSNSLSKVSYQMNFIFTMKGIIFTNNGALRDSKMDTFPKRGANHVYFTEIATTQFINIKSVIIDNSTVYDYNFGSAVCVYSTSLLIKGQVQFIRNRGMYGGAIYLKSNSILLIHSSAEVKFYENKAYSYGGAIYSDCNYCPIRFLTERKGFLMFTGNLAYLEGDTIYFKGLQYCHNDTLMHHISSLNPVRYQKHHSISSPPVHLIFCMNNLQYYNYGEVYPGSNLQLNISAVDKNRQRVYAPITISVTSLNTSFDISSPWYLPSQQNIQLVRDMECTHINLTILQRHGDYTNPRSYIELGVLGQLPSLSLMFIMKHCPVGFQMRNDICDCDQFLIKNGISNYCNINTRTITLNNYHYWIGVVSYNNNSNTISPYNSTSYNQSTHLLAYSGICPNGYCKRNDHQINVHNWNHHCHDHRSGILCGGCIQGYTVAWGTTECVKCPHDGVWAMIAIPLISIVIVFILFLIRLNISNGILGSIIFYANIYAASVYPPEDTIPMHTKIFYFFIACLNDTVNYPVCIYSQLTSIMKASSFFIFPLFLISIVLALVIASRYSVKLSNFIAPSSIQVLATLIYLSFAKLLLTSINILLPAYVHTPYKTFLVWYVDGNVPYWGNTGHIVLTLIALVVIIVILLPFLLFTTFGSLLFRCQYLRPYVAYMRPFLDAYQGPYKSKFKYWFGVRLWILFYVYICFIVLRSCQPTLMSQIQVTPLIVFSITQAWIQPYRQKLVNLIDLFVLSNICTTFLIKIASWINRKQDSHSLPYLGALVLSILLLFISLVIYHGYKVLKNKVIRERRETQVGVSKYTVNEYEQIPDTSDNQLREPLLENNY